MKLSAVLFGIVLTLACISHHNVGAVTVPIVANEDFESFGCGPTSSVSIFGGFGTAQSANGYVWGSCSPWSLCYAGAVSHGNRAMGNDFATGGITITLATPMDFFSGYLATCRTGCCADVIQIDFYLNSGLAASESRIFGNTGGALTYYEKYICFDKVVISANWLAIDDLTVRSLPPSVACPTDYPNKVYEYFEQFSCGQAPTSFSIFGGAATLSDNFPYIWGSCQTFSLCYANAVASGSRSYGHDHVNGGVTITFTGQNVYGFGGNFATCQGPCCTDLLTFQYFLGNTLIFTESISFGATGGVMSPYIKVLSEFSKVVITGNTFAMDNIYYLDRPYKITPTDNNLCSAVVQFPNVRQNICRSSSFSTTHPSGTSFPVGITWVTNSAADGTYSVSCSFAVVVKDLQEPTLTCPSNILRNADPNQCSASGVSYSVPMSDNCGLQSTSVVPTSPSSFPVGVTPVQASATDIYANSAGCKFEVAVRDTQAPTITCPATVNVNAQRGKCESIVTFPSATAADNCAVVTLTSNVQSGFAFPIGTTPVTFTAWDAAGLSASCTFNVVVNDISSLCLCGNGRVDTGEQCEVNQLGSATCASKINPANGLPFYPDGGVLDCVNCQYDYSRCAVCGDGRVDGTEECDSSNMNQQTCISRGFTTGTLACSNTCRFVTTGCNSCGNGVRQGSEQCDRSDLNGQTCASVVGSGASGTLSCNPDCTFNTLLCNAPKITAPDGSKVQYITLGISVSATGFTGDRKVVVSMTDGTLTQSFPEATLSLPAGSITATFRPTLLKASNQWRVYVKGTTTLYQAQSVLFTVKNSP